MQTFYCSQNFFIIFYLQTLTRNTPRHPQISLWEQWYFTCKSSGILRWQSFLFSCSAHFVGWPHPLGVHLDIHAAVGHSSGSLLLQLDILHTTHFAAHIHEWCIGLQHQRGEFIYLFWVYTHPQTLVINPVFSHIRTVRCRLCPTLAVGCWPCWVASWLTTWGRTASTGLWLSGRPSVS